MMMVKRGLRFSHLKFSDYFIEGGTLYQKVFLDLGYGQGAGKLDVEKGIVVGNYKDFDVIQVIWRDGNES